MAVALGEGRRRGRGGLAAGGRLGGGHREASSRRERRLGWSLARDLDCSTPLGCSSSVHGAVQACSTPPCRAQLVGGTRHSAHGAVQACSTTPERTASLTVDPQRGAGLQHASGAHAARRCTARCRRIALRRLAGAQRGVSLDMQHAMAARRNSSVHTAVWAFSTSPRRMQLVGAQRGVGLQLLAAAAVCTDPRRSAAGPSDGAKRRRGIARQRRGEAWRWSW